MNRTRICLFILLIAPLAVYWQTIFHEFGWRDDYALLRESREEPGKIVHFTASHGRPLYGALLETSFYEMENVPNLQWGRLVTVLLLTLLGLALWRQLYVSGWNEVDAAAIGLGVILLPSSQVAAAWATSWPHVLAVLLGLAGFSAIETELERGGLKRLVALIGGCFIYALAGLIYQTNALFAVVPIAAVLLVRTGREPMSDLQWLGSHVAALLVGVFGAFGMSKLLFYLGIFQPSARLLIETHVFSKLVWFFWHPLPNALALFALRDDHNRGVAIFWLVALLTATVIGFACRLDWKTGVVVSRRRWLACLILLPIVAEMISLAAAERAIGYRVIFPLAGLTVMLLVYSLRRVLTNVAVGLPVQYAALGLIGLFAAVEANRNSFTLIAEPQGKEWEIVQSAGLRVDATHPVRVFLATPTAADRTTDRIYGDEFGSLSSDSDWVAREMFLDAIRLRFPDKLPKGAAYKIDLGHNPPAPSDYDLLIDLRKLKAIRD